MSGRWEETDILKTSRGREMIDNFKVKMSKNVACVRKYTNEILIIN